MNAHRFGTIGKRRDRYQYIVQRCNKKNCKGKNAHDGVHALHLVFVTIHVTNRFHESGVSIGLLVFFRTVLLNHGIETGVHDFFVGSGTKADVFIIAVASTPGIVTPTTIPTRRHRHNTFGTHRSIRRQVSVSALHGELHFFIII